MLILSSWVIDGRLSADTPKGSPDPVVWDLDSLYRRYASYVAAVAYRLLGRDDEVDDIVQDVFLQGVRYVHQVREPAAIKGWLATITVHMAQRKLRRRKLFRLLGLADAEHELPVVSASQEDAALTTAIYRLLDRIPVKERIAWSLRHLEGEPLEKVAELCHCSLATAKRRIASAQSFIEGSLKS